MFDDELVSEIKVDMTWNPDGTIDVSDNRGYRLSLGISGSQSEVTLFANSTVINQKIARADLQYDVFWSPVKNDDGKVDRYKFVIEGVSENATSLIIDILDEPEVKYGVIRGSSFTITQSRASLPEDGTTPNPSLIWDSGTESEVDMPMIPKDPRNLILPEEEPDGLRFDWSDIAESGGQATFDPVSTSLTIPIKPGSSFFIDPVVVGTTSKSIAPGKTLAFQDQLRLFTTSNITNARLNAFFYNGTQIVYKTSDDQGDSWSSTIVLTTGNIGSNNNRWSITPSTAANGTQYVHLFYWTISGGTTTIYTKRGVVSGLNINWGSAVQLGVLTNNNSCGFGACVSVTASSSSDGTVYAAFIWNTTGGTFSLVIKKSADSGLTWSDSLSQINGIAGNILIMTMSRLESAKMLFAYAKHEDSKLLYRVNNGTTWGSEQNVSSNGMQNWTRKQLSSVYDESGDRAYVAYSNVTLTNGGILKVAKFFGNGTFEGLETADDTLRHYTPDILPMQGDEININTIAIGKIYNTRKVNGTWEAPSNPYGTSFSNPDELTATTVLGALDGALWKEGTSSPFNVVFGMAAVPEITWSPASHDIEANPLGEYQLNFTSSEDIPSADVIVSSEIEELVAPEAATLSGIVANADSHVGIVTTIASNMTEGWYNGTISLKAGDVLLDAPVALNIRIDPEALLASEHLEILSELDQIGETLNETTITQELVADINSTLTRLKTVVVDLQNLGFDGNATAERVGQKMVGTVRFYDNTTLDILSETQVQPGALGIFAVMGLNEEFTENGLPLNHGNLTAMLNSSRWLADVIASTEDEEVASGFVLAGISKFHPSTGHSFNVVAGPIAIAFLTCLRIPLCETALLEAANYLLDLSMQYSFPRAHITGLKFLDEGQIGVWEGEDGLPDWNFTMYTSIQGFFVEQFERTSASDGTFDFGDTYYTRFYDEFVLDEDLQNGWNATTGESQIIPFDYPALQFNPALPWNVYEFTARFGNQPLDSSINVSNSTGASRDPDVDVNGASVYVVWTDTVSEIGSEEPVPVFEIQLKKSTDGGDSFGSNMTLSSTGNASSPQVAVSGSNVYVVWDDTGTRDVYFSRSNNSGSSFSSPVNLSNDSDDSIEPRIIASGNDVYIMWRGDKLVFVKSANSGATFGSQTNVNAGTTFPIGPVMERDGNGLYFAWSVLNGTVYFKRSIDSGNTFNATVNVHATETHLGGVSLAASGSDVYVVWHEQPGAEQNDIYLSKSTNGGGSFASPVNLSSSESADSNFPVIEVSDDDVHVTWAEGDEVSYLRSSNGGTSWDDPVDLSTPTTGIGQKILMALESPDLFVVWEASGGADADVFAQISSDGGDSFSGAINVSNTEDAQSESPAIVAVGSTLYVVYVDARDPGVDDTPDIFFSAIEE